MRPKGRISRQYAPNELNGTTQRNQDHIQLQFMRGSLQRGTRMNPIAKAFYSSPNAMFYLFQLIFWLGLMLFTFFSLTLWYNTAEHTYILHTSVQAALGVIISFPLRNLYTFIWARSFPLRTIVTVLAVVFTSAGWTGMRMITFVWIVHEEKNVWLDFGGWYFGSFFIFFCWTAMYYCAKYYNLMQLEHRKVLQREAEIQSEQNKRLHAEAAAREAQLAMLRYQLNPHFLFNTLNAIYALIRTSDNATAQLMIQKLSKFLRYSLDNDPSHLVNLEKELDAVMLYLDIEKARFGDRLNLIIDVSTAARKAQIPSFLLQPLVENAIKYAISMNELGGTIGIEAQIEADLLILEVWDDGPGLKDHMRKQPQGRGIGLRNTLERLQLLHGDRQTVDLLESDTSGLRIKMRLPFKAERALPDRYLPAN